MIIEVGLRKSVTPQVGHSTARSVHRPGATIIGALSDGVKEER